MTNVAKQNKSEVVVMSDSLNYLLTTSERVITSGEYDNLTVVYDSVLANKEQAHEVEYTSKDEALQTLRSLLDANSIGKVSLKGLTYMGGASTLSDRDVMLKVADARKRALKSEKNTKEENVKVTNTKEDMSKVGKAKIEKVKKASVQKKQELTKAMEQTPVTVRGARKSGTISSKQLEEVSQHLRNARKQSINITKKGAPSLPQYVLDERYDILSEYSNNRMTSNEVKAKLNVTDGVFRNMVTDYNRCKRLNRKKAFGKAGIIQRTYKQYENKKINASQAAFNVGVSVPTFMNWYKADMSNK